MANSPIIEIEDKSFRLLVEAITDYAIYLLDPTGIISSWNPGAKRFKGYEASEIIGEHFSRFYTEGDRALGLPQRALAIAAEKGSFQGEGWRVRKDGTNFWASVVIDPIRGASGQIEGFAKITRDLTERREAEQALHKSEEQFRLLVQGVSDYAIYMLDPDGRVVSWNQGAQHIKGYLPDEIIGEHFSKFYTEKDRRDGAPKRTLETALREGRFEKEGARVRKDGTEFIAHVIVDPVRDSTGKLIGFAKVTRDVTDRKIAEAKLEKARESLFQSQKMDAVGQLTGGVAHDFNNLLTAVIGSLELLGKRLPDDPQAKRLLNNAMQGAQRGATLTQRMLTFARRQPMQIEQVDLGSLVQGLSDLLQRSIGPGIELELRLRAGLPPVRVDVNQLELAILNLSTNARDAMPHGGKLTISTREIVIGRNGDDLPEGRYVCLAIADEGMGMDAETLAKATEPFFTTKGVGKGTGLGLPMVHGMSEQFGGRLVLKSEKDKGTLVEVYLPADMSGEQKTKIADDKAAPVRPLVILAVDDDALVLLNTVAMLEDLGHTVIEAMGGEQALTLMKANEFDLVITDQSMPQMTGLQLIEAAKKHHPDIPMIIATGYAELPANRVADLGILNKPFNGDDLARAVGKAVGHGRFERR